MRKSKRGKGTQLSTVPGGKEGGDVEGGPRVLGGGGLQFSLCLPPLHQTYSLEPGTLLSYLLNGIRHNTTILKPVDHADDYKGHTVVPTNLYRT